MVNFFVHQGFWRGPERNAFHVGRSKVSFKHDVMLSKDQVCDLLMADDRNVSITCKIDLRAEKHEVHKKLLETGYFSDCEVTSEEGMVTLVHSVFLEGKTTKQN